MKLLSQFELEQWNNACVAFDNQDYDTALSTFIVSGVNRNVSPTPFSAPRSYSLIALALFRVWLIMPKCISILAWSLRRWTITKELWVLFLTFWPCILLCFLLWLFIRCLIFFFFLIARRLQQGPQTGSILCCGLFSKGCIPLYHGRYGSCHERFWWSIHSEYFAHVC